MRRAFVTTVVLVLVILTCACNTNPSTPTPDTTNILFYDNFSNIDSGWNWLQNESGIIDYVDGQYRIFINKADTLLLAPLDRSFQGDVRIEVDARRTAGPNDNYFGVLCRYQDPDNYYMFLITSDGYTGIAMRKDGLDSLISPGLKFLKMDGINKGTGINHIRADCVGDALTLYANGTQVSLAYDRSFTSGAVGLAARSGKFNGGVDILFDNFGVYDATPPTVSP